MFHRRGDRNRISRSRGVSSMVALIDYLLEQRSNIEVGARMTLEWTGMFGFENKLDDRNASSKNDVLHEVAIPSEGRDEGPNELLANGRLPLHETAWNLNRHILRVVRHDAVLIGSAPRGVILAHECFDIIQGCGDYMSSVEHSALHCMFGAEHRTAKDLSD